MVSVLGAGCARPSDYIDESLLQDLNPDLQVEELQSSIGSLKRATVLPIDYLRRTNNADIAAAFSVEKENPTSLAVAAARMALERAQVNAQQVGLVICDTSTPRVTIPAEATRIAKVLGIKVPAYDVIASSCAFIAHLDLLASWKVERVPEYVLLVSTNVLTAECFYGPNKNAANIAPYVYSDGAAALLVSAKQAGRLKLCQAEWRVSAAQGRQILMKTYAHAEFDRAVLSELIEPNLSEMISQVLSTVGLLPNDIRLIGPQSSPALLKRVAEKIGTPLEKVLNLSYPFGDSLGATPGCILAESWDLLRSGEKVLVALAGAGFASGYALLEVR